jgi:hypothetical protein
MRHCRPCIIVIAACVLLNAAEARAGGGFGCVGGSGGSTLPSGHGVTGTVGGMSGFSGLGGCCGGFSMCGFSGTGFGGCCGGIAGCSFGGCMGMIGMCGGCGIGGCFGSIAFQPSQSYSSWNASPGRSYYYRTLTVHTPPPSESALEFILVYHPERPRYFYYYDPVERKFFGRYSVGIKPEQCFSLLSPNLRKASLKDVADLGYGVAGPMPTIPQIIRPRPGTTIDAMLQNTKLMRPPESLPNEQLGLPAEEPTLKKK